VYRAVPRETLDLNTKSQTTRKVIHNNSGIVINIGLPLWDFPSATRKRSSPYATYYAVRNVFYSNANSSKSIATDTGSGHCTLVFVWSLHMGSIYINFCPGKVANINNWLPHEARGKNLHLCARFAHDSRVRSLYVNYCSCHNFLAFSSSCKKDLRDLDNPWLVRYLYPGLRTVCARSSFPLFFSNSPLFKV